MFARGGESRDGDFCRSAAEVRRFAWAHDDKNVYVAPNPTAQTAGDRHSAVDVTHWSFFLIDVDPVEPDADPAEALEQVLLQFGEAQGLDFAARRPVVIDSGRGMQAWFRLEDVVLDDSLPQGRIVNLAEPGGGSTATIHRATARRINGYWLKRLNEKVGVHRGCRIDTSVSDLPRVMRCPGTRNAKTGRETKFLTLTDVVFAGLAHRMAPIPKEYLLDPEPPKGVGVGRKWQEVFPHLTRRAQVHLTEGADEGQRHSALWHTAKKLHELAVSRDEARRALRWANKRRGEGMALLAEEMERALDTVYGRTV